MWGWVAAAIGTVLVLSRAEARKKKRPRPRRSEGQRERRAAPVFPVAGGKAPRAPHLQFGFKRSEDHTHQGVDIFARRGTVVRAPVGGTVEKIVTEYTPGFRGYGRAVVLRRERGDGETVWLLFAHLDSVDVAEGTRVAAGAQLGTVGRSAFTEAAPAGDIKGKAHLHFEVSPRPYPQDSEAPRLDPAPYLGG